MHTTAKIPLSKGRQTLVDSEDYRIASQWKWHFVGSGYAARTLRASGKKKMVYLHRLIMNAPKGFEVDHINGNKLDNRRSNLRLCNSSQNKMNRPVQSNNTSGYKGVTYDKQSGKWKASLYLKKKYLFSKKCDTPEEASEAYKKEALKLHGEFAKW